MQLLPTVVIDGRVCIPQAIPKPKQIYQPSNLNIHRVQPSFLLYNAINACVIKPVWNGPFTKISMPGVPSSRGCDECRKQKKKVRAPNQQSPNGISIMQPFWSSAIRSMRCLNVLDVIDWASSASDLGSKDSSSWTRGNSSHSGMGGRLRILIAFPAIPTKLSLLERLHTS